MIADWKLEEAEKETSAQLEILAALKPLDAEKREHVLRAIQLLMEADRLVPGILSLIASWSRRQPTASRSIRWSRVQAVSPVHRV